jgi:hypothetical protein
VATIIGNCGAIAYVFYYPSLTPIYTLAYLVSCLVIQWRRNCRLRVTSDRSPSHHHRLRFVGWRLHPALDSPQLVWWAVCRRILAAIWRAGGVGGHPDPAGRDEPARFPRNVPRCHLSTGKCKEGLTAQLLRITLLVLLADPYSLIDGLIRIRSD